MIGGCGERVGHAAVIVYSPNLVEGLFREVRIDGVLGSRTAITPLIYCAQRPRRGVGKGARSVHVLQIEYPVPDYGAWKAAFDRDLLDREGSGVRRYRVLRPTDDPNYVLIDLEFDEAERAEAYLAALQRQFYSSQDASPAVGGGPQTRIVEVVEAKEY